MQSIYSLDIVCECTSRVGSCVEKFKFQTLAQEILGKVNVLEKRIKAENTVIKALKDLNLPHACREVVDKGANDVLREIEDSILLVAVSILRGDGFAYTLPNRSKSNQLYVPGA